MPVTVGELHRHLESRVREVLTDTPALLIHGPRQCGKTTLVKAVGESLGYRYVTFDDPNTLEFAQSDPLGFVRSLPRYAVLDEVQRVPRLFTSLKLLIDEDRYPGRYLMTGSANVLLVPRLADSLAGRMEILRLHPLSQAEIEGTHPSLIDALLDGKVVPAHSDAGMADVARRLVAGGYPEPRLRKPAARASWHKSHAQTMTQRDVQDLSRIRAMDALPELLAYASAETSGLVNYTDLANTLRVSRPTALDYVTLLRNVFVLDTLGPWSRNATNRLVKTPKLHIGDTGLAAGLLGLDAEDLVADRQLNGKLTETFVFQELQRQASALEQSTTFSHFRDRDGHEVDIVLERGPRRIAGVEVKAAASVQPKDFRGLRKLRDIAGEAFRGGAVLYNGPVGYRHDENLWALPISMLWEAGE